MAEISNVVIYPTDPMKRIETLEAALIEERAIWIYATSSDGLGLVHMSRPKAIGECWKKDAREQLEGRL